MLDICPRTLSVPRSAVLIIGECSRIFPGFSWGILAHVTGLNQSLASENIVAILTVCINSLSLQIKD